jgi:hypothetical protein
MRWLDQPQQASPTPQHASAPQHDAARLAMAPGEAASAAELETSKTAATSSFFFIIKSLN